MKRCADIPCDLRAQLSPELRLILLFLSKNGEKSDRSVFRNTLWDVDWEKFLQLSDRHCVGPLIFGTVRQGALTGFPDRIRKILAAQHKTNVFVSMNLSDALCRVADQFQRAEIPMISLKGPGLAQLLFNDTSLRLSSDLDILVPADDLDSVEVILKNMGYRGVGRNRLLTKRQQKLLQTVHHHRTFIHSETGVNLEVHWRLSRLKNRFLREHPFGRLWLRADRILLNDVSVPILGPIDNFLYLCLHGAYHQWSRLSWLYDVHEILKRWPDVKIKRLFCQHRSSAVGDILGQTLVLLKLLFDIDYTIQWQDGFNGDRAARLAGMVIPFLETCGTAREATLFSGDMYRIIVYMFVLLKTNADRIQYINGLLMPTDLEIQTLSIPDALFPLYFLFHPVCTVYRSMAKMMGLKDPFASSTESF